MVVNAAGITRDKSLLKMTEEAYDDVIRVNLKVSDIHCYYMHLLARNIECVYCHISYSFRLSGNIPGVSGCGQGHGGEWSGKWLHCQHSQHLWEGIYTILAVDMFPNPRMAFYLRVVPCVLCVQLGNYGQANYSASKGGVMSMTLTFARELGR